MIRLFVATGNKHKTGEIRAMLGEGWHVEDLSDHPHLPNPVEDGATFSDNATIKALAASGHFKLVETFADRIAKLLIDDFKAPWVKVSAAKIGILPNAKFVGVSIERKR